MKVYTIRDVARIAGVSVTTVSRVLNHRPDVNPKTRHRIEKVIEECQFVGNTNARGLKQSQEVIAMVIRGRSNPFLNDLAEGIQQLMDQLPDPLITEIIDEQADEFMTAQRIAHQHHLKGLLFVGSLIDDRVQALQGLDIPVVFTTVHAANAALPRASSVAINDRALGRRVAEELLALGHRRIAVFGSNPVAGDSLAMRFQGFCEACEEQGFPFLRDDYRECRFSFESGYEAAKAYFSPRPAATALFAMSDSIAVGAIRALTDLGLRVPEDVSVVGFDGTSLSRFSIPRLTTVEQPVEEIARASVRLLREMMEQDAPSTHVVVDAVFRLRESVARNGKESETHA